MTQMRTPVRDESPALRPSRIAREQVEELLYLEAALLDDWEMDAWLELWSPDARYIVPTNDNPGADPDRDLMYINHDRRLLQALVTRLKSVHAHREYPWSKTRHFVTNIRILGEDEAGDVHVHAAFMVVRYRNKDEDRYVGQYRICIAQTAEGLKLRVKYVLLDAWTLAPIGAISILL